MVLQYVTGPAKIDHEGSKNLTTFQTFVTHNVLLQYGMAIQFSGIVHNLTGFPSHFTEPKCYISVLRCVSSNQMVYFSPYAPFLQAQSHICTSVENPYIGICQMLVMGCHCRDFPQSYAAIPLAIATNNLFHNFL